MYQHKEEALREGYQKRSVHCKIISLLKNGGTILYEAIDQVDEVSAYVLEVELIKKYGRKDNGTGILCNLTDGGEGSLNQSKQSVERRAAKHRGMKRSEESKQRMKRAQEKIVESNLRMYGQKRSPGSAEKQSASTKGKSWSEVARSVKRNKPTARPVVAHKKDTNEFIGEYESISEAARQLKCDITSVWKLCEGGWTSKASNGKMYPFKSHKGYIFQFKN